MRSGSGLRTRAVAIGAALCTCVGAGAPTALAVLPDGRGYELVSPAQKTAGVGVSSEVHSVRATRDGQHVFYGAIAALPGSLNGLRNDYESTRQSSGWITEPLMPAFTTSAPSLNNDALGAAWSRSDDGRIVLYESFANLDPDDRDAGPFGNAEDLYRRNADGSFTWITRGEINQNDPANGIRIGVMSADGQHVIFTSAAPLLPEDSGRTGGEAIYHWHAGQLELVSIHDDGTPVSPNGAFIGSGMGFPSVGLNAVSHDGLTVYFTADNRLYLRSGGHTRAVSPASDPIESDVFEAATPDGSRAYFATQTAITADDTDAEFDLYEYRADTGGVRRMSSGESGTATDAGVDYGGGVRTSDDGSRIYFLAHGALTADAPAGADPFVDHLYAQDGDGTTYIATVPINEIQSGPRCQASNWRVSPDGGHVVFATTARVTPDDLDSNVDLFEYAAEDGSVRRVSRGPLGGNDAIDAVLDTASYLCNGEGYHETRVLSDDGRFVFFRTAEALASEDVNGKADVYRYDESTDTAALVSSGTSPYPSNYLDSGASGRDVFFSTFDRLVPQDIDYKLDVYDARIGGGFPVAAPLPPCQGDACQGPRSGDGTPAGNPASRDAQGDTVPPLRRPSLIVRAVTPAQIRALARTGRLTLRVRTDVAGRVTVSGRAVVKRRSRTVMRRVVTVPANRTRSVTVRLSGMARHQLALGKRLVVRLTVKHSGGSTSPQRTLRLRARPSRPSSRLGR